MPAISPIHSPRHLVVSFGSLLAFTLSAASGAEKPNPPEQQQQQQQRIAFPDPRITVSGLGWWKEGPKLQRLPDRLKASMPPKVWSLAQCTAGVRLRFRTDSIKLGLLARTGTYKLAPSPPAALIGVDIYVDGRYLGSGLPELETSLLKREWVLGTEAAMRDVEIYLPIGGSTAVQEIVLNPGAKLELAAAYAHKMPIVYYGSSITQGGHASNPGMTFPCILGRWLKMDFINLGFSGNGLGEPALASAVAEIPAAVYVVDYWANPPPEVYEKTFPEFIRIIRAKHPETPIVVTGPYYNPSETTPGRMGQWQLEKRKLIPRLVAEVQRAGDKNIHYVDGFDLISPEQADALSDARHANSYGMFLYARGLEPVLRKVLGMPVVPRR